MKRLTVLLLVLAGVGWGFVPVMAQQMEDSDQRVITENIQSTLEYNQTNQAAPWVNPDTGNAGTTVPLRTFANSGGQPCREFVSTIVIAGEEQQGYGTACRQPDGTWQIVPEAALGPPTAAAPTVEKRIYVYDAPRPYGYYNSPYYYGYYPYGYYGPWYGWYPSYWPFYPVSFSFGFIHTKGHGHHHYYGHRNHSFRSIDFRGQGFGSGHSFRSGGSWSGGHGFRSGGGGFRSGGAGLRSGGGGFRSGGGGRR